MSVMNHACKLCVLILLILSSNQLIGKPDESKISEILNKNKAQVGLIRSFWGNIDVNYYVTQQDGSKKNQESKGFFLITDEKLKAKVNELGTTVEFKWDKSVRDSLITKGNGDNQVGATRNGFGSKHSHWIDPYIKGLVVFSPPETVLGYPLGEALKQDATFQNYKVLKVDDSIFDVITYKFAKSEVWGRRSDWEVTFFFGRKYNYLLTKVIYKRLSDGIERTDEALNYKDFGNGVFFPTETSSITKQGSKVSTSVSSKITNISINFEPGESDFDLNFPKGIILADSINKTYYQVNENGEAISSPVSQGKFPPPELHKDLKVNTSTEKANFWGFEYLLILGFGFIALFLYWRISIKRGQNK